MGFSLSFITKYFLEYVPLKHPWALLIYIPLAILTIYLLRKNFIIFSSAEDEKEYKKRTKGIRMFMIFSRLLIFLLLVIALASPFIIKDKIVQSDPRIKILADSSFSFKLFDTVAAGKLKDRLESKIPTELTEIAKDDRSPIADGILNNIEIGDSVILVTDGNNNYGRDLGDAVLLANQLNSTINAISLEPIRKDTSIVINGPRSTIEGSPITLEVKTIQAGNPVEYSLTVKIDGSAVFEKRASGSNTYSITKTLSKGYHEAVAEISTGEDYFQQNNLFRKTINVIAKPKILFLNEKSSPLQQKLSEIYDTEAGSSLPENLKEYTAVVVNDLPKEKFSEGDANRMVDYVTEGGGLFVIGGQTSYDMGGYKDSLVESLLPAKSGISEKEPDKKVNIILVIDISGSTGATLSSFGSANAGEKKVDIEKALAVSVLNDLKDSSYVGVVAFNSQAFRISELSQLGPKKDDAVNLISALKDGGGTDIQQAVFEAEKMLLDAEGSKNIILVSDGMTIQKQEALGRINEANSAGTKTYSVGVGQDSDEQFMQLAAAYGGGIYFKADQSKTLKILFGEPDEDEKKEKNLVVLDANHFITKDVELAGKLAGYNQIVPKTSASTLVTLANGAPVLVVWRFGLGRVASLATDDGSRWGAELLAPENSKIITRTINWVIGDPSKSKSLTLIAEDTYVGKPIEVILKSKYVPASSEVSFVKVDEETFSGVYTPKAAGFFDLVNGEIAVNEPREYYDIGMSDELKNIVAQTGGEMFKPEDIQGILDKTIASSKRKETQETSFRWPFMLLALLMFLFEIVIRRVKENIG